MTDSTVTTPGAVKLKRLPRALLVALGVVALAAAAAILVFRQGTAPDLLLAALAICGLVSAALAIVGRLPSGFQVAGMHVTFTVDTLSDLLGTIRGLDDVEDAAKEKIVKLIKTAADPAVYAEADAKYGNATQSREGAHLQASSKGSSDKDLDTLVSEVFDSVALGEVVKDAEVDNSGNGKKPKFHFRFEAAGPDGARLNAVSQIERYWNPSSVDLLGRKLNRALLPSTDVTKAIVIVPRVGLSTVEEALAQPGVLVTALEDFARPEVMRRTIRTWLARDGA